MWCNADVKCAVSTNLLVATGADSCWIAALLWLWTSADSLMTNCWCFTIAVTKTPKTIIITHMGDSLTDFYIFHQDSAPAHTACEMVEFLDRETLHFLPLCCLALIRWTLFISEPDKVHRRSRVASDSTNWDRQACTHDTLWRHRYITISKEYSTNGPYSVHKFWTFEVLPSQRSITIYVLSH